jgi:hypothetical protein
MTWRRRRIEVFDPSCRNRPGKIRRTTLELRSWISTPAKWLCHSNAPIPPFRSHRVYLRSKNRKIFELAKTVCFGLHHLIRTGFVPRGSILFFSPDARTLPSFESMCIRILEILTITGKLAALDGNRGFGYTESLNPSGKPRRR